MDKQTNLAIIIFALVVIGSLIWGVVGGIAAQDRGVTCNMGIGDVLCWRWHTNTLGQVDEFFNDLVG